MIKGCIDFVYISLAPVHHWCQKIYLDKTHQRKRFNTVFHVLQGEGERKRFKLPSLSRLFYASVSSIFYLFVHIFLETSVNLSLGSIRYCSFVNRRHYWNFDVMCKCKLYHTWIEYDIVKVDIVFEAGFRLAKYKLNQKMMASFKC